jgi:hypothetical protein
MDGLSVDTERFATGHQHARGIAGVEDGVDEAGAGVEQVLAVVQDEQHRPGAEDRGQRRRLDRRLTFEPERFGDSARHLVGVPHRRELGEHHVG